MTFAPTDQQQAALALFTADHHLSVEALAGTGKTSTLVLAAQALEQRRPRARIHYLAFNRAIRDEAVHRFPGNTECTTAHAAAMRSIGRHYKHRLGGDRMSGTQLGRHLGTDPFTITIAGHRKTLTPGFVARHVMRTIVAFCQSADAEPSIRHVPYLPGLDMPGEATSNNAELAQHVWGHVPAAWGDLTNVDGRLPFAHDHYLKMWQLTEPLLPVDVLMFDEAQDANPVIWDVVMRQRDHAQVVVVGDRYQQIYEWRGAMNAMAAWDGRRTWLTESFRFGPEIAEVANVALEMLGSTEQVVGRGGPSRVAPLERPRAVLTRTNTGAVSVVFQALARGQRPAIVGGADDIVAFARAAQSLARRQPVEHRDLCAFGSWSEVLEYVKAEPDDHDLVRNVRLIEEFGATIIIATLERCGEEGNADVIVSTAHKAKGREWPTVQLHGDYPEPTDLDDGEIRLLYVAATRGREVLDIRAAPAINPHAYLANRQSPLPVEQLAIGVGDSGPH